MVYTVCCCVVYNYSYPSEVNVLAGGLPCQGPPGALPAHQVSRGVGLTGVQSLDLRVRQLPAIQPVSFSSVYIWQLVDIF